MYSTSTISACVALLLQIARNEYILGLNCFMEGGEMQLNSDLRSELREQDISHGSTAMLPPANGAGETT